MSCTGKHFFAANDVSTSAQTSLSHFSFQIAIYQEYTAQRESTITIQSWLRMCAAVHERMQRMVLLSNVIKIQAVFRRHLAILRVNDIDRVCSIFEVENTMDVECVAVQERRGRVRMRNAWKDIILCGGNYSNNSAATAIVSEISFYVDCTLFRLHRVLTTLRKSAFVTSSCLSHHSAIVLSRIPRLCKILYNAILYHQNSVFCEKPSSTQKI